MRATTACADPSRLPLPQLSSAEAHDLPGKRAGDAARGCNQGACRRRESSKQRGGMPMTAAWRRASAS